MRDGDLGGAEEYGRAALEQWQRLPAAHSSCVFEWSALLPLVAVALARDRTSEAVEWALGLLDRTQQRLPAALADPLENAFKAWGEGDLEVAGACLEGAIASARELGYL